MGEIHEEISDGILRLTLSGLDSIETTHAVFARVMKALESGQVNKVLAIDRLQGEISPIEIIDFEKMARENSFPRGVRVALVDLKTGRQYNDNRFMETVAYNRGWANFRVFQTEESALEWLKGV
jgi:hypothetical protein